MRKLRLILILCCIFSLNVSGQNSTQERRPGSFSGINVCCGIEVNITDNRSSGIKLEGNPEVLDAVKTEVKNGVLNITFDNNKRRKLNDKNIKVKVDVPVYNYNKLEASSGGFIKGQTELSCKKIKLGASSGGQISVKLNSDEIACSVSSGAGVTVSGNSLSATLSASSGGSINMSKMEAGKVSASASSAGGITVCAKDEIKANASSGGSINYYGNPVVNSVSSSSGGSINKK